MNNVREKVVFLRENHKADQNRLLLLKEAANAKPTYKIVKGKRVYEKPVPVYLQSVSNLCNQLLRAGTSIGAKTRTCSLIPVGS